MGARGASWIARVRGEKEVAMDRMQSIELALKNEKTEMEYYLDQAKRSRNAVAREMFETLADDEREHMTRIRGLHDRLISGGAWPRDVALEVRGTNIGKVLDGLVQKVGAGVHC
jgi:rubrerythrin